VKRAKEAGLNVTAEVTLIIDDERSVLLKCSHACTHRHARTDDKMAPPLRGESDQELCCKD